MPPRVIRLNRLKPETKCALLALADALRQEEPSFTGAQVTFDWLHNMDQPPTIDVRVIQPPEPVLRAVD